MQKKNANLFRKILKPLLLIVSISGVMFVGAALGGEVKDGFQLSSIATNVDKSVTQLATVLTDIALIAGIGFVMASFFKFHQHKLNPTQVPMSQGVTLLLIGAGLILFPSMLPTAKNALFGPDAKIAKVGGGQISSIIGGKT